MTEIYKSTIECYTNAFYGLPIFRIVEYKNDYVLEYLDCDNKEYIPLKKDKDFSKLHSLALKFDEELRNAGIFTINLKEEEDKVKCFIKDIVEKSTYSTNNRKKLL